MLIYKIVPSKSCFFLLSGRPISLLKTKLILIPDNSCAIISVINSKEVQARALSYQERKIVGPDGQHSRLHESRQVDRLLINFLWK